LLVTVAPASANWVASGTFVYEEREWDQNGFTGVVSQLPIRFADVEVIDPNKSGTKATLARGKTDVAGAYSISVTDSSTRTVYVRVLGQTTQTTDLFVKVVNKVTGSVYAVASANVPNHNPNTNVNFGTLVAAIGNGGEPFNIFDLGVYGADYIQALTRARPNSPKLVTFQRATHA